MRAAALLLVAPLCQGLVRQAPTDDLLTMVPNATNVTEEAAPPAPEEATPAEEATTVAPAMTFEEVHQTVDGGIHRVGAIATGLLNVLEGAAAGDPEKAKPYQEKTDFIIHDIEEQLVDAEDEIHAVISEGVAYAMEAMNVNNTEAKRIFKDALDEHDGNIAGKPTEAPVPAQEAPAQEEAPTEATADEAADARSISTNLKVVEKAADSFEAEVLAEEALMATGRVFEGVEEGADSFEAEVRAEEELVKRAALRQ